MLQWAVGGLRTILALLALTVSASPDDSLNFKIESQLQYLLNHGFSSVKIETGDGFRTDVFLGVNEVRSDFSDMTWNAAQRVSLLVNNQVLLSVHQQNMLNLGRELCWLRARKGQVFDGTC